MGGLSPEGSPEEIKIGKLGRILKYVRFWVIKPKLISSGSPNDFFKTFQKENS